MLKQEFFNDELLNYLSDVLVSNVKHSVNDTLLYSITKIFNMSVRGKNEIFIKITKN